jgi:hypothetical protein
MGVGTDGEAARAAVARAGPVPPAGPARGSAKPLRVNGLHVRGSTSAYTAPRPVSPTSDSDCRATASSSTVLGSEFGGPRLAAGRRRIRGMQAVSGSGSYRTRTPLRRVC